MGCDGNELEMSTTAITICLLNPSFTNQEWFAQLIASIGYGQWTENVNFSFEQGQPANSFNSVEVRNRYNDQDCVRR